MSGFLDPSPATGELAKLLGIQTPETFPALNSAQRLQAQQPSPVMKQSQELFCSTVSMCKLPLTQKRAG